MARKFTMFEVHLDGIEIGLPTRGSREPSDDEGTSSQLVDERESTPSDGRSIIGGLIGVAVSLGLALAIVRRLRTRSTDESQVEITEYESDTSAVSN